MGHATQIAFQLDDDSLEHVDRLAVGRSRAAVIRAAVHEYLARRREDEIDQQLARGYEAHPPGATEMALAAISVQGLALNDLDW